MKNKTIENMEAKLSKICGFPVELTIRGDKQITLSADGKRTFAKAVLFFGEVANLETIYDEECDMSCLYLEVA